jgi:RNA ligase
VNFYQYIGIDKETFLRDYLDARLVQKQEHPIFPLDVLTYSRTAVHDNIWDEVTSKCRGVIVHRETGEIIARPFEKFHNFGSVNAPHEDTIVALGQPVVWEKLDGFLCTMYRWEGQYYVASKGSFTSPHAKWATARIQALDQKVNLNWPEGYTPVFEGLTPNLRIVVDYGNREGLVLTALINNETGEEVGPSELEHIGRINGVSTARQFDIIWQKAVKDSLDETVKNEEGYVLTWYRQSMTPFRLKVKFQDYLRLHRLVTTCSPKRILEALMNGWSTEVEGMMNDSTPWFAHYVKKWKKVIEGEYERIEHLGDMAYETIRDALHTQCLFTGKLPVRKDWALLAQEQEFKEVAALVFAKMDGKETAPIVWKMIKNSELFKNGKPLVDGHLV